jgi:hypothetical protein
LKRRAAGQLAIVLASLLIAVAGAGCGSGSSSTADSASTPLSKAEFRKQAGAICENAQKERKEGQKEAVAKGEEAGSAEEAKVTTEALLAPVRTMTAELSELGAPKGQEKQVQAIVAAFEAGIASLEANPTSPQAASAFAKADKLAIEYGLTDCVI